MPQGEGGGASREQNQRAKLVFPSGTELAPAQSLLTSLTDNARGRTLSYDDLSRCFHLPINAAAKELGVCVTALKKQCRKHGVPRWPHRKLKSLDKLKEKLEKEEATAADKEYYKHEIHSIAQKKDHIFRSSAASAAGAPSSSVAPTQSSGAPSSGHAHPGHQLVVGRPIAHFPPPNQKGVPTLMAPNCAPSQGGRPPTLVPFSADGDKPQMVPASMVVPFPHMPGVPPGAVAGPNGTIVPQGAHPGQYPLCGIYGCDCYMNNGVSSRMYHSPIQIARGPNNAAAGSPNIRNGGPPAPGHPTTAGPMPNVHYFNPGGYAYGPAIAHMGPYQNMVQVNVVEQPSFPHGPRPQQPTSAPGSSSVGHSSGSQSQPMMHHAAPTPAMQPPPGYEVYGNVPPGANGPANGFVYSPFIAPSVHYNGVMEHPPNGTAVPNGYWTEMQQHPQNSPGNMVTMCNQTVHHHHHHGDTAATASPVLTDRPRQGADNTSSKTNNSEARHRASSDVKATEPASSAAEANTVRGSAAKKPSQASQGPSKPGQGKAAKLAQPAEKSGARSTPATEKAAPKPVEKATSNAVSLSAKSQPERVEPKSIPMPNGRARSMPEANGTQGTSTADSSEASNYSRRSNEEKLMMNGSQAPKWNKRPRITSEESPVNAPNAKRTASTKDDESRPKGAPNAVGNSGVSTKAKGTTSHEESAAPNGIKPPETKRARTGSSESPRKRDVRPSQTVGSSSPGHTNGTGGSPDFAKRYDHVVHQCLGLQTAQWCTDLNFKVTLALGPKALLGLAGVPSLGRSVLDGTDSALDDTRAKYALAARGQRFEWIATSGRSRYLVVMNPYRKRNTQEITGVSGMVVELKIIQALPK